MCTPFLTRLRVLQTEFQDFEKDFIDDDLKALAKAA
jgi:hypothetical protein